LALKSVDKVVVLTKTSVSIISTKYLPIRYCYWLSDRGSPLSVHSSKLAGTL